MTSSFDTWCEDLFGSSLDQSYKIRYDMCDNTVTKTPCKKRKRVEEPDEEPGTAVDLKAKVLRVQCRKILLTYKTHLDKDEYTEWFHREKKPTSFLRLAHENGDEKHPYQHTHVLIHMKETPNWKKATCLDYKGIHPNLKKVASVTHWKNARKYLGKEDPENQDLLEEEEEELPTEVASRCENELEFLNEMMRQDRTNVKSAPSLLTIWRVAQRHKVVEKTVTATPKNTLYCAWQKEVLSQIMKDPTSPRTIKWIFDTQGNTGKTVFANHLSDFHGDKVLVLPNVSRMDSVAFILSKKLKAGWKGDTLVFDVARGTPMTTAAALSSLEQLKNGRLISEKYEPTEVEGLNLNHIVVLTNSPPPVGGDHISMDRWDDIHEISPDGTLVPHKPDEFMCFFE